jgi:hypothetical protein
MFSATYYSSILFRIVISGILWCSHEQCSKPSGITSWISN